MKLHRVSSAANRLGRNYRTAHTSGLYVLHNVYAQPISQKTRQHAVEKSCPEIHGIAYALPVHDVAYCATVLLEKPIFTFVVEQERIGRMHLFELAV